MPYSKFWPAKNGIEGNDRLKRTFGRKKSLGLVNSASSLLSRIV
jgi:hypothetical protein